MTRDESTEGWLPMSGGGLAHVSIRKRTKLPPDASGHGHEYEWVIFGQRISDQTVILSCVINRDLQYFKVMPTFHHWRAGKQRNGLTFQTAADARAFDKGIVKAYDDLLTDGKLPLDTSLILSSSLINPFCVPLQASRRRLLSPGTSTTRWLGRTTCS